MQIKITSIEDVGEEFIASYAKAVRQGMALHELIEKEEASLDDASSMEKINLFTYQFYENWLEDYDMHEIDWIVNQFPWLARYNR